MNARMVGRVHRARIHAGSHRPPARHQSRVKHIAVVDGCGQSGLHKRGPAQGSNLTAPRPGVHTYGKALDALRLAAPQRSCICCKFLFLEYL